MTVSFPATRLELERWRGEGRVLPVWWRDDDAVEPTAGLERLLALAGRLGAPLHLAVIPAIATADLVMRLRPCRDVFVLTHGWKHENHASPDRKKAEFGPDRPLPVMLDEIVSGKNRLSHLFGEISLPIFTPPWNRIATQVTEHLSSIGFRALSTFTPRIGKFAAGGILRVNTHLDPIAWKSGKGLLDPEYLDGQLARELAARRTGLADNEEPYGLLTHHLVQDEATWQLVEDLLEMFSVSGVPRWTSPLAENK